MPLKDPIKRKEYEQKWRKENKELCRKWRNDWNKKNTEKRKEMDREQRRKFPWKKHYDHAKQRCTNPNHDRYSSYGGKGIKFLMILEDVKYLYIRDKAKDMIKPSIDRKNTYGNYTLNNCRFIEFEANNKRPKRQTGRNPILQFDLNGKFIMEFEGVNNAKRETNISSISHCLLKNQKTAGGFIWKYKEVL